MHGRQELWLKGNEQAFMVQRKQLQLYCGISWTSYAFVNDDTRSKEKSKIPEMVEIRTHPVPCTHISLLRWHTSTKVEAALFEASRRQFLAAPGLRPAADVRE